MFTFVKLQEYAEKNRPVIITDVVTKWEAYKKWNEADLIARFGDTRFRTDQPSKKGDKVMMTMADYFQYLHNIRDSDPIYMFDPGFGERGAALLGDYEVSSIFVVLLLCHIYFHLQDTCVLSRGFFQQSYDGGSPLF